MEEQPAAVAEEQPGEEEREVQQWEEAKRSKRERKEYMQEYYRRHKVTVPCIECMREFSCPRALKHHQDTNYQCLLSRLVGIWDEAPNDSQRIVQLIQEREMRRIRRLVSRGNGSGENRLSQNSVS